MQHVTIPMKLEKFYYAIVLGMVWFTIKLIGGADQNSCSVLMITTPSTTLTHLDLLTDSQSRGRFHQDRSDLKIVGPLYTNDALKKLLLFP